MANYWIRDAKGRVLGPIDLVVLRELIGSGRIRGIIDVSGDGQEWSPVAQNTEIAALQAAQTSQVRRAHDLAEVERLRGELLALKGRPPHAVFGIEPDAPIDAYRAAFFRLVKRFYPDNLPPEAAPELKEASADVFGFLARLMSFIEKQPPAAAKAARPPPVLATTDAKTPRSVTSRALGPEATPASVATAKPASPAGARAPAAPAARPAPTYAAAEFAGIERRNDDRISANVKVTAKNRGMFTDNRLLNISRGGAFIPCDEPLALGSKVDLVFNFEDVARVVQASGTVMWWSAGDARQPRGFGVKFVSLAPADRSFIEEFTARAGIR